MEATRFAQCHKLIMDFYRWLWREECPWDASEATNLSKLLKANPSLDAAKLRRWLYNYALSKDYPPGERPRRFLPRIHNYSVTNLNVYSRDANDTESYADRNERASATAFDRARSLRRGPEPDVHTLGQGIERIRNQPVARRPLHLPHSGD